MAEYLIQENTLIDLGDKIRVLMDTEDTMTPAEMQSNLNTFNTDMNIVITEQDDLIDQIAFALEGKVGGFVLPTLEFPGTAEDLVEGKQLIGNLGQVITGTRPAQTGSSVDTCTVTINKLSSGNLTVRYLGVIDSQIVNIEEIVSSNGSTELINPVVKGSMIHMASPYQYLISINNNAVVIMNPVTSADFSSITYYLTNTLCRIDDNCTITVEPDMNIPEDAL